MNAFNAVPRRDEFGDPPGREPRRAVRPRRFGPPLYGVRLPQTWDHAFELARVRPGFVPLPLWPLDALTCLFTLFARGVRSCLFPGGCSTMVEGLRSSMQRSGSLRRDKDGSLLEILRWALVICENRGAGRD